MPEFLKQVPWQVWAGLIAVSALVLVVLVILLILRRKKSKRKRPEKRQEGKPVENEKNGENRKKAENRKKPPEPAFSLGKVHEIGAREGQQDSFSVSDPSLIDTHGLLAVVADGMGGLSDGDQVSQRAVTAVMECFYRTQGDPQRLLLRLVEQANTAVNDFLGPARRRKSGSTMVLGLLKGDKFYYLSIGDSRICLLRQGRLCQLNREHVFRHELNLRAINGQDTWEAADTNARAAGLTSFLGMGELKYLDVPAEPLAVLPGDKLILMSDGVYNALTSQELLEALSRPAPEAAQALRERIAGKQYTDQDNYTAIIIDCGKEPTI